MPPAEKYSRWFCVGAELAARKYSMHTYYQNAVPEMIYVYRRMI